MDRRGICKGMRKNVPVHMQRTEYYGLGSQEARRRLNHEVGCHQRLRLIEFAIKREQKLHHLCKRQVSMSYTIFSRAVTKVNSKRIWTYSYAKMMKFRVNVEN